MTHHPQGHVAAFWRRVPCGDSDRMGRAMNDFDQRLMASQQGTGRKKRDLSTRAMRQSNAD